MSWKNFPWQYNRYNISVWPRYLMITVLQLWKLFSDSAWDSHIFTFDFIISCSRTASLSNISWNVLKVLVALFPLPTEPDIVQQNSEERLYTRQEFHYLNVFRVGATTATDESDCCFQCLRNPYVSLSTWPRPKQSVKDFGASCYLSTSITAPRNTNQTKAHITYPSWWD